MRPDATSGEGASAPLAVIGAGYVGVVQAAGLAALGRRVRVGERDPDRVRSLAAGRVPFYEQIGRAHV